MDLYSAIAVNKGDTGEFRKAWRSEGEAMTFLKRHGWHLVGNGLWRPALVTDASDRHAFEYLQRCHGHASLDVETERVAMRRKNGKHDRRVSGRPRKFGA